jgi:molybdopterin molybdotransferase
MITVQEAEKIILQYARPFPGIAVFLEESSGRVLAEDLFADRDLPPFDRVSMDGIAIHHAAWREGARRFFVEAVQPAGSPRISLHDPRACIEVMTGAVLPEGCDCVVPFENVDIKDGLARLKEDFKLVVLQNVHEKGSDYQKGSLLLSRGCRLLPPQIAVAASIGKSEILVSGDPRIAVIATGDELVEVDQPVEPFQIRQSNVYAIDAALRLHGHSHTNRFHIKDDRRTMTEHLRRILIEFDIIILSGGVSMGKFDYVPEVLKDLGVEVCFHKIKQRPGKPFWFGISREGKPVFALPGNPVSTQVCLHRYVLAYLRKASGVRGDVVEYATLTEDVRVKTSLTYFLPVKLTCGTDGRAMADPVHLNGSGDYASLAQSDGFIELGADAEGASMAEGTDDFPQGTSARFYRWGS